MYQCSRGHSMVSTAQGSGRLNEADSHKLWNYEISWSPFLILSNSPFVFINKAGPLVVHGGFCIVRAARPRLYMIAANWLNINRRIFRALSFCFTRWWWWKAQYDVLKIFCLQAQSSSFLPKFRFRHGCVSLPRGPWCSAFRGPSLLSSCTPYSTRSPWEGPRTIQSNHPESSTQQ